MSLLKDLGDDDLLVEIDASQDGAGVGRAIGAGERAGALLGKRILFLPFDACGECDTCRRGGAPVCPTARRRVEPLPARIHVAARWAVALDDGLDLPTEVGAKIGPLVLAYTMYARSNLAPREPTIVVGDNDVARYLVQILVAKGIEPVAIATFEDVPEIAASFEPRSIHARPWRILATTPDAVTLAAQIANPRAQLTSIVAELPANLAAHEVTIITVAGPHPDLVVEVAAMCLKGELTA